MPAPRADRHRRAAPRPWPVPPRLRAVVARLPGYRPGEARWVLRALDGHWGTADVYHATVYVSPAVPARRLYDVVVHEWAHLRTVAAYDGDVAAAVRAVNAWFGGTGWVGSERAADCVARLDGASWTGYTTCPDPRWRAGARRLAAGLPL